MKSTYSLRLEFEEYDPPATEDGDGYCNIAISIEDGADYVANVWSYQFMNSTIENSLSTSAKCVVPPDLLVPTLSRATIEAAVEDLIANGGLPESWRSKDDGNGS